MKIVGDPNRKSWDKVTGFFTKGEGIFLLKLLRGCNLPTNHIVLEIGSLFGKSTCCLASGRYPVVSIDPHEGEFQKVLHGKVMITRIPSTYQVFIENLKRCRVDERIEVIKEKSEEVVWNGRPLAMLFIDGIHDTQHVAQDFWRFHEFVSPKGYVAFHDYGSSFYPEIKDFVDNRVLSSPAMKKIYEVAGTEGTVLALKKLGNHEINT